MKISEIIDKVKTDKNVPGRFPSRVIFVQNFDDFITLVKDLDSVCDITLNLADFVSDDKLPDFDAFCSELKKHGNKTVLLLSFGEYLRLCAKREQNREHAKFRSIWEPSPTLSANVTTKYIIPIFGGRDIFDNAIPYVDQRLKSFVWEVDEPPVNSEFKINVFSPNFAESVETDANNFSDWLAVCDKLYAENRNVFSLKTRLFKFAGENFSGIRICVISEPFTYITSRVTDGENIKREYGNDEFWSESAKYVQVDKPFSATIDYALNIGHSFDAISILVRFAQLTLVERQMFWIRYKLYPCGGYISQAIAATKAADEIPAALRDTIFKIGSPTDNQLTERQRALQSLDLNYDKRYFAKLDKLSAQLRFVYLSFKTLEEWRYAIKTASDMLRNGTDINLISDLVKQNYPALAEYLSPVHFANNERYNEQQGTSAYFNWYRKNKLINRLPEDISPAVDLSVIDSRNKIIQNSEGGYPFWVDGLGAEWLPLILAELKNNLHIETIIESHISKSVLPSITEYNLQWAKEDEKWDKLDDLSHNGLPDDNDYFSCIAMQFKYICEIVQHVGVLLKDHNCVILTGDHGSSRLAALMFHSADNFSIDPPQNAKVRYFGRFCELSDENDYVQLTPSMEVVTATKDGKVQKCVVMKTYEHFKQSGNAAGGNNDETATAGEIHGGMTPEECLVPVVIIKRKIPLKPAISANKRQAASQNDMGI